MKTYLTDVRIILSDEVIDGGSLLIEDDCIAAINPCATRCAESFNLRGQILMPGMIDLHCDVLEKEVEPRPGVHLPLPFAVSEADKRSAASGIATPFHALSFANQELGVRNDQMAADIVHAVHAYRPYMLVDNRVHCRYEITNPEGLAIVLKLLNEKVVDLVSVMDHTPGQGQFRNVQAYVEYLSKSYHIPAQLGLEMIRRKQEDAVGAMERAATLIETAREMKVPTASHDDESHQRIERLAKLGVSISEFPVSLDAAAVARNVGLQTVFGAPNLLRGKSQNGLVKVVDAVRSRLIDCLCADYYPGTLLAAAFLVPELTEWTLPQAIRLVTVNPARAAGLGDRGAIAVGKRADLVAVRRVNHLPQVVRTWIAGRIVYQVALGD